MELWPEALDFALHVQEIRGLLEVLAVEPLLRGLGLWVVHPLHLHLGG